MFSHGMEYAFLDTIRLRTSSFGREVDTFGTSDLDYQQDLCTGDKQPSSCRVTQE